MWGMSKMRVRIKTCVIPQRSVGRLIPDQINCVAMASVANPRNLVQNAESERVERERVVRCGGWRVGLRLNCAVELTIYPSTI